MDTTTWTLATVLGAICSHPEAYAAVSREIQSAVDQRKIVKGTAVPYEEAVKLEYLQACLQEAMRLWPTIATGPPRVVPALGIDIDGYFIPPGSTIGLNCKQLGLTEEIFGPDTASFRPERWLEASKERRQDMEMRNFVS